MDPRIEKFVDQFLAALRAKTLRKLVISNPVIRDTDLRSIIFSLVELKRGSRVKTVYRYKTKDVTNNLNQEEVTAVVAQFIETGYRSADLFTAGEIVQLSVSVAGKIRITSRSIAETGEPDFTHDRQKNRIIRIDGNIWLRELGILNGKFSVIPDMNDKYQQINRYIELLDPVIRDMNPQGRFHVVDMGCGKGYLTFALYDYLVHVLGKTPVVTGVEARPELVARSNEIAVQAYFSDLQFRAGQIRDYPPEEADILIALHACDTATDEAIAKGIIAGSSLIVCAPCCHKQIRKEFKIKNVLKEITRHGIIEERLAELITDGLRALCLEAYGYSTRIIEFIDSVHTPKNSMIMARKISGRKSIPDHHKLDQIKNIKEMFGIQEHALEQFLRSMKISD